MPSVRQASTFSVAVALAGGVAGVPDGTVSTDRRLIVDDAGDGKWLRINQWLSQDVAQDALNQLWPG